MSATKEPLSRQDGAFPFWFRQVATMSFGLIVESAEKREGGAAGCARGHIVGEGIRPNWAHLAHL